VAAKKPIQPVLAELQQEAFVEINRRRQLRAGIRNGERVWLKSPTGAQLNVQAMVTERVGPDTCGCPSTSPAAGKAPHAGLLPKGAAPVVRGEAVNTGNHLWL